MPFTLLAQVTDVTLRAKEFASLGSTEILLALNDAALVVNTDFFGTTALLAQAYLAAHYLSIRNPALAQPAGPISEEHVGDVSAQYAVARPPAAEADYNSSRWGREFITLARQTLEGRVITT